MKTQCHIRVDLKYVALPILFSVGAQILTNVVILSRGMSYSKVCGTVQVHREGTPDGFDTFKNRMICRWSVSYRVSSNEKHIWTYSAAGTVRYNNRECDQ